MQPGIAACGWCLYDFRFDVKNVDSLAALPVRVGLVDCQGAVSFDYALTLPEDAGDSGILCRYANPYALDDQFAVQGRCGERFSSCNKVGSLCARSGVAGCNEGLTCVEVTSGDSRCLEECSEGADCTASEVSECSGGVCNLRASF